MGVVRIVFVTFTAEHHNQESRDEVVAQANKVFPQIPGVTSFRAGTPAEPDPDWDLVLEVGFDRREDVEPYRIHELHVQFVTEVLKPRMQSLSARNVQFR